MTTGYEAAAATAIYRLHPAGWGKMTAESIREKLLNSWKRLAYPLLLA
jgi:hypothetical protein